MAESAASKSIGGFRVLRDLKTGAGSQGKVYQAVCEKARFPTVAVGDIVALKVMSVLDDGEAFSRLEKRTAELVRLDHPNVVRYHGCFRETGPFSDVHVLVLEFVEGRSLKELLAEAPCGLGADEAMRIAFGLIDGLAYTSSRGIVHRDIKPGNVIVRPDGTPKLIDFEVARREGATATLGGGNMIGTFDYMAPDFTVAEFRGDVVSDVFSMGVVLHEMLTGRTPYRRSSKLGGPANVAFLQRWIKAGTASSPLHVSARVSKLLSGARDLFARALAPERDRRIPDFSSFRAALEKVRFRELSYRGRVWRLLNYIGHGGFGEVFAAVDRETGERVAVKHLLNASGLERFRREANAMRRVAGSCFPQFIDFFTSDDGDAFLVMEYLDGMPGQSLKSVLKATPGVGLDRTAVIRAFVRYAHGLADLHTLGLVHRDIKPANLYFPIATPERAAIMDLGIARDVSGTATVGQVPGTIDYMPPECVTGQDRGGPEADVWALGLCLCEALSGKPAYPRLPEGSVASFEAYYHRMNKGEKPDFSGVDSEARALLNAMCAIDPSKRIRDIRIVERRLRIMGGENPENLPVPESDFDWREAPADADFADVVEQESFSGATRATVWGGEEALARARSEFKGGRRRWWRRVAWAFLLPLAVGVLAWGGLEAWRFAERRRMEELDAAGVRARQAAIEAQKREEAEKLKLADEARKAKEQLARERTEQERLIREKAAERGEAELRKLLEAAEAERLAKERAEKERIEKERIAKERAEQERLARKKAEAERLAKERAEKERAEKERIAKERAEKERQAREKAEAERLAKERAEKERAEKERIAKERAEQERLAREKAEAERLAKERAEKERIEKERAKKVHVEKERMAREAVERERNAQLKQLDDSFADYTDKYEKKMDAALKPGSTIDAEELQREYLVKRKSYREARKKLLEKKP